MGAYSFEEGVPCAVIEDRACAVEEAKELIGKLEGNAVLLGDGAYLLAELADGDRIVMSEQNHITGRGVAYGSLRLEAQPPERLIPSYFRLSQAEREYQKKKENEKNGSTGL